MLKNKHVLKDAIEDDLSTSAGGSDNETHGASGDDDALSPQPPLAAAAAPPAKLLDARRASPQLQFGGVAMLVSLMVALVVGADADFLNTLWSAAIATSTEILLFACAMAVYGILFQIRRPKEPVPLPAMETKKEYPRKPRNKKTQPSRPLARNNGHRAGAQPQDANSKARPAVNSTANSEPLTLENVGPPPGLSLLAASPAQQAIPVVAADVGVPPGLEACGPPPGVWDWRQPPGLEMCEAPPGLDAVARAVDQEEAPATFDVTVYRKEVSNVLRDLANGGPGHNVASAVQRIRACAVPEERQAKEFCDILTRAAEEPRGAARRLAFAFTAGLGGAFLREECINGLQFFFWEVFEDLAEEVPRLRGKIANELAPALKTAFLTAEELERIVPPDCRHVAK